MANALESAPLRTRRLPICPPLAPGESLASWVDRIASETQLTRPQVWLALGLTDSPSSQPLAYGAVLDPSQQRTIALATGEDGDALQGAVLSRYDGVAIRTSELDLAHPETVATWARNSWVFVHQSHACPSCLQNDGNVWSLAWKLPWSIACTRHHSYLLARCPDCGTRLQSTVKDWRGSTMCVGPRPGADDEAPPGQHRRRHDEICGRRVHSMPTAPVDDATLTHLQELIHGVLEQQEDALAALVEHSLAPARTHADILQDLRRAIILALTLGTPQLLPDVDDVVRQRFELHCETRELADMVTTAGVRLPNRTYSATPSDPLLVAAALRIAAPLVTSNAADTREHAQRFTNAVEELPGGGRLRWWHVEKFWEAPAVLRTPLRDARDRNSFAGLTELDGRARRRRAPKPMIDSDPAERVPTLCWELAYTPFQALFSATEGGAGWRESGRRFVALNLLILLAGVDASYEYATAALGLPAGVRAHCHRLTGQMRRSGATEELGTRLRTLAHAIANTDVPIPYGARRRQLALLRTLPDDQWHALCEHAGWNPRLCPQRRELAAAWVWATLTGGDWHFAPALNLSAMPPYERNLLSNNYRSFAAKAHRWEEPLTAQTHRTHQHFTLSGPLTWAPPPHTST